jgi:cytochrome d ubiquinol oxidase subunit II
MDQAFWLPVIWAALIAVAVAMYVVLDGFDLGIGILFPAVEDERMRDQMMNTVAPFWDGNETWLVLGGAGLWVAFPLAYATILPAVYEPAIVMLLALIFRGVAFEFRWAAKPDHSLWDAAFIGGSVSAAFAQGVILGTLIQGVRVEHGQYAGGDFDWATPFTLLCGLGLVAGYAMLGATWLVMKADGHLADRARRLARPLLVGLALFAVLVSAYTAFGNARIAERWFDWRNAAMLWPLPVGSALLGLLVLRGLASGAERTPFFGTIGIFLLCYAGLAASNAPMMVPPSLTLWDAAASPASQGFSLVGTLVLLPVVLAYTAFAYWTFRGKVTADGGYH